MNGLLGLCHKAVVISESAPWGCFEHKVRYTHNVPIPGPVTEHGNSTCSDRVQGPASGKGRAGVYSPSTGAGWTSDIIQISLNVRAGVWAKPPPQSRPSSRCPQPQHRPASTEHWPALGPVQAVNMTPTERVKPGSSFMRAQWERGFLPRPCLHSVIH